MTDDDLRTRAREAAEEYSNRRGARMDYRNGYLDSYYAHAAQQPSREQIAEVLWNWLAAHDRQIKVEALREYAALVEEIANLGANNTGLRTPHHLAEYTRNYADRIAEGKQP